MKLEQLRAFEAVSRLGTFTAAADALFVTQPSLSRQIAALEQDLATDLFERGASGARLTVAGETLLPVARRMLADAELARQEIDELAGLRRGRLRIGAPPTLCVSILADALARFSPAHPGVELHVTEAGNEDLVIALNEGQLDLALVVTRESMAPLPGTELVELLTEELVVVSASAQPDGVAELPDELTLAELAELPQVMFNRSYDLRVATDASFAAAGLRPRVAVEGGEMDAVLRFVELGIGVAVVPAMTVPDRAGLRVTRLVRPGMSRTVNLARRSNVRPAAAVAAMQAVLFELLAELDGAGVRLAGWD
ncbi:LysR family transcriptional regulator [Gulosibacter sediminis]|uniref:LysR family transcriptional regulator n=1 Tax=Gulosibacter sediminis TaxID=1729695 RepID=UPI0024A831A3|nr:LysR family transcriptional regulator [Gulosibacter sediminis]